MNLGIYRGISICFGLGIPIFWLSKHWNSKKIFQPESSELKTESEFRLQWGSQKSEPKIRIPNLAVEKHCFGGAAPTGLSCPKRSTIDWILSHPEIVLLPSVQSIRYGYSGKELQRTVHGVCWIIDIVLSLEPDGQLHSFFHEICPGVDLYPDAHLKQFGNAFIYSLWKFCRVVRTDVSWLIVTYELHAEESIASVALVCQDGAIVQGRDG